MLDRHAVSRERVIGISFVDILIQAVFILFIALLFGYIDPLEMQRIKEYEEAGLDLCHKLNKDSAAACREYVKGQVIVVEPPTADEEPDYTEVGKIACRLVGKENPEECAEHVGEKLGSLRPCLPTNSQVRPPPSIEWDIRSPSEIQFVRFSPVYERYLNGKSDSARLQLVKQIQGRDRAIYAPKEIEENFGFVRENECYHESRINWSCECSAKQLSGALSALSGLKALKK